MNVSKWPPAASCVEIAGELTLSTADGREGQLSGS
jgi:hypothetical protein